jgi:hypothetical protein
MRKSVLIVFTICLLGCREQVEPEEYLTKMGVKFDESRQLAIVIPQNGCPGCLRKAFNFYHRTRDSDKVWFVFTEVYDLRLLKMKVKSEFGEETTVFDEENEWRDFGLYSNYPLIVIKDNDRLISQVADPSFTDVEWVQLIRKYDL